MTVDSGLAPREDTPGASWDAWRGTCFACQKPHPLVGDPRPHMREVGERYVSLIVLGEPEVAVA